MIELMWGKGGTGIPAWQPECPYFHGFVNKSRDVIDKVALGKVQPRRGITKIEGKMVWFQNETEPEEVDHVIFATGYHANVPFLTKDQTYKKAYKLVFDPNDPTLCFIGSARPMIGSIPALGELQARWAAKVFSGKVSLPAPGGPELVKLMNDGLDWHKRTFPQDDRSLPQLVNHWAYSDEIAGYMGVKPKYWKWFFRSPAKWWLIISAPWSAHIYRVEDEDPKSVEFALQNIGKTWLPNHYPFRAFNYVMLTIDIILLVAVILFIYFIFKLVF